MDKKQFIEYDNKLMTTGTLDKLQLYTVVKSYCIDKGISVKVIDTYLPILMATIYKGVCISSAFNYYEEKFGICQLISKDSNGEIKVIKVY